MDRTTRLSCPGQVGAPRTPTTWETGSSSVKRDLESAHNKFSQVLANIELHCFWRVANFVRLLLAECCAAIKSVHAARRRASPLSGDGHATRRPEGGPSLRSVHLRRRRSRIASAVTASSGIIQEDMLIHHSQARQGLAAPARDLGTALGPRAGAGARAGAGTGSATCGWTTIVGTVGFPRRLDDGR